MLCLVGGDASFAQTAAENPFAQSAASVPREVVEGTAEGVPPPAGSQAAKLLDQLDKMAKDRSKKKDSSVKQLLSLVERSAANPQEAMQAYMEAYRDVELAGKVSQAQDWQAWKDKNSELFVTKEFRGALQLHLQYMLLTIKRAQSKEPADFVVPSIAYLKELAAWEIESSKAAEVNELMQAAQAQGGKKAGGPKGGGKGNGGAQILKESVANSVFAKAWNLAPFISGLQGWEMTPSNAEGILEQNIRAVYRPKKDPKILETWDWQIQMEEARLENAKKTHLKETFRTRRLPELEMKKGADRAKIGQPVEAASDAMKILSNNMDHPSFEKWVKIARQWLMGVTTTDEIASSGAGEEGGEAGGQENP